MKDHPPPLDVILQYVASQNLMLLSYPFQEFHLFEVRDVENKRIRMEKIKQRMRRRKGDSVRVGFRKEMKSLSV